VILLFCLCVALFTLLWCFSCIVAPLFFWHCCFCSSCVTISFFLCYCLCFSRAVVLFFSHYCLILLTLPLLVLFIDLQVPTSLALDVIIFTLLLHFSHCCCSCLLGWYGTSPPLLAMCRLKLEHQVFKHQRGMFLIFLIFLVLSFFSLILCCFFW
jgi:hypothetical protein